MKQNQPMGRTRNLQSNTSQNFILRGFNSIQIGLYLLLFAYVLKSLLDGFLSDVSLLGMMSIEVIETVGLSVLTLFILLSGLAVFFSNRRRFRKLGEKVWNKDSKSKMMEYYVLSILGFVLLFALKNSSFSMYLPTAFLAYLALMLVGLNRKRKKPLILLASISLLLGILSFLIPSYWYSSFLIVGIGFVLYGIMIRK